MPELLPKGDIPTAEILKTCAVKELEFGTVVFTSDEYFDDLLSYEPNIPFQLCLSREGVALVKRHPSLLGLFDQIQRKRVQKLTVATGNQRAAIAVKQMSETNDCEPKGVESFLAFQAMEQAGISCASPLMASRWKFVTQWVKNNIGSHDSLQTRKEYMIKLNSAAKKLQSEGKWDARWVIDQNPENYFINNLSSRNVLEWYTTIDTILVLTG